MSDFKSIFVFRLSSSSAHLLFAHYFGFRGNYVVCWMFTTVL